jgi:hypothetical protein
MQYGAQPIARFIDADGPGGLSAYALSLEDTGQAVFSGTYPSLDRRVSIYGTVSASGNTEFQGGSASGNRNLAANSSRAFGSDTAAFGKSLATGNYSFAAGHITTAAGAASHVEGINNTVNVGASAGHAEGFNNTAAANYAHAEGTGTSAGGVASHAEGISNTASASGAHAEGTATTASKPFAHAEGHTTTASGSGAHAEGFQTTASGNYSHAEGGFAQALSLYAHAEGNSTSAGGAHSHAEGSGTAANNTNSHAEGSTTTANGAAAHAEGSNTTADGTSSHAEGSGTQAVSTASHAEGVGCVATGEGSHAEGVGATFTNGAGAHAEGGNTGATAAYAHSEGLATGASAAAAHAEGILTQAAASGAHTGGYATSASGIYSFAHGRFAQASKQDSISLGFSARAVHDDSFVFSSKSANVYSSTSFANDTFNVYATGGIEFFDPVTVGDPLSAVTFIVTTSSTVGINLYNPLEALSVVGNISASGSLSAIGAAPNYFVGNVGIGLSANKPTALLTVLSGASALNPDNAFGTTIHSSNDGGINRIVMDSFGGQYAVFTGRAARGNSLAPTAVQNKDLLSQFTARGRGATSYPNASNARMNMYAGQNFTDTAYGTFINFEVTAPGTTVATPIAQLSSTGLAVFGSISATADITSNTNISAIGSLSAFNAVLKNALLVPIISATNLTAFNASIYGILSSGAGILANSLTSRYIDLIHTPANDGVNPVLRIGENDTVTAGNVGFSGAFISYNEGTNTFCISADFDPAAGIPAISITRDGKVGIGLDVPVLAEQLTVKGSISAQGSLSATGINNNYFAGNVGIGTNTPEQALHVLKASAGTVTADTNSIAVFEGSGNNHISILTPDAQTGGVVFGSPTDNYGAYVSWNHDNNALRLATAKTNGFMQLLTNNEAEAVRITSSGNVGIGTIIPSQKLTVSGSMSASNAVYASVAVLSTNNDTAGLSPTYLRINNDSGNPVNNGGAMIFTQGGTTYGKVASFYENALTDWRFTIGAGTTPSICMSNTTGNVGIGSTNTAAEKLTVTGNISSNGSANVVSLSSRFITLVHTPANDGTNARFDIGEFDTATAGNLGFSGFSVEYNEINNKLVTQSTFAGSTTLTATTMDRFGTIEQPNGWYISSVSQVSAIGINQATAGPIYTTVTTITGAGVGLGGLILPPTNGGHLLYVYNFAASNNNVYPQVGGRVFGYTVNAPVILAPSSGAVFQSLSANFWITYNVV